MWVPFDREHEGEDDGAFPICIGEWLGYADNPYIHPLITSSRAPKTDENPMLPSSFDHASHQIGGHQHGSKHKAHKRWRMAAAAAVNGGEGGGQWSAKVKPE